MPRAVTTPASAITDPADRSMPPLMITIVIPIAPNATITVWESTMRRLVTERYWAGQPINRVNTATTRNRPKDGPSHANQSLTEGPTLVSALKRASFLIEPVAFIL